MGCAEAGAALSPIGRSIGSCLGGPISETAYEARLPAVDQCSTWTSETFAPRRMQLGAGRLELRVAADDALHLFVRQRAVGRLRGREHAIDDVVGGRQAAALEPEDHVRSS